MPVALLAGLGGCQGKGTIGAGVDLFHGLQGGAIAEQRPPPPGVNDPFPNLGAIPKRPPPPDVLAEQRIADQLAAQRDQAEQDAAANPLTPRQPPPPATPKKAAAPDPNANRVVVDAAPTPAPVPPPKPAAPAPAAAAQPAAAASSIPSLASVPAVAAPLVSGPLPSIAAAPPASPIGLGPVSVSPGPGSGPTVTPTATAAATATGTASVPVTAAAVAPKPLVDRLLSQTVTPIAPGDTIYKPPAIPVTSTVAISFTPGSAELPPSAPLNLRRFALAHKGVAVTITGHGEAVLPGADSQSRALDLALRRAQAIAASLASNGIPAVNLHLHAEAAGLGGSVGL